MWARRKLARSTSGSKRRNMPALCYHFNRMHRPLRGAWACNVAAGGRPAFLNGMARERLEELVISYNYENDMLHAQRADLRKNLRRLVERYLQMKLPRMGLEVPAAAARETLQQVTDAQRHRVAELRTQQMALRLRVRSLAVQLAVQRRLADQARAGITRAAPDSDEEVERKITTDHLKAEVLRLRERVEDKKQELSHLRRGLALWRREAHDLRHAIRVTRLAVLADVLDIRRRRQRLAREEDAAAARAFCPVRDATSALVDAALMRTLAVR